MLDAICHISELNWPFYLGWADSPAIPVVCTDDDLGLYCAGGEL